ncbi:cytidine deaminase [Metabacillus sp. 84]|uniref:cytidine deaminase n=1 Tax=Metabacillus sp. 84 TaxID=3404705 RepID=UPI003CF68964
MGSHAGAAFSTLITAARIGRITDCAEAIARKEISEGHRDFESIVAVRHPGPDEPDRGIRVVALCGMRRGLIGDYGEKMTMTLDTKDSLA